ncbi:hypothetical protein LV89_00578 [Arcicella aurantiaca]|uniref:Outer membrane protein with beta-barrel domain n=1 Tax=Arcicella aurantiaca TaxID=591202 RepID=A0A316EGZ0_9BACT|nr:hypothetical protein [Arcicella aurantiaca]PWK29024.1 hypothetical protein LV89_00578 [Arcicella aurantiaca]
MKKIITGMFLLVCTMAYSQEKTQNSFKRFVKENYVNFTDIGGLFGKSYQITPNAIQNPNYSYTVKASTNFTIQTFNGLKVYKNLAVGATVGVDWFSSYQIIPISLGIRNTFGDIKTKKVKTFAGIDAGFGFMWLNDEISPSNEIKGGLAISPMVGLLIPTGGNANFTLSVGYKHNRFKSKIDNGTLDYPYLIENQYNFNRMAIRLGVNF